MKDTLLARQNSLRVTDFEAPQWYGECHYYKVVGGNHCVCQLGLYFDAAYRIQLLQTGLDHVCTRLSNVCVEEKEIEAQVGSSGGL